MLRSLAPFKRREASRYEDPFVLLQREMNRLFDENWRGVPAAGGSPLLAPSMDVKETDTAIEVEAELPGVDEKDVQVTFDDGVLTVKGEKKSAKDEDKGGYHLSERSYGSFLRRLELPAGLDVEKISADFAKGVLKVTLPKLANPKAATRKIEVKAAK